MKISLQTCAFAGLSLFTTSCLIQEKAKTPNFLFILVDDLGYMDVGCNNPNTINTNHFLIL
ncbi:MAG: hypothetical protein JEZ14_14855 [Marinilabiliaceae bacterium]|nr:hypothetical protein [Marinilabiliaceae bacterium]